MRASQLRATLPVLLGICLLYGGLPPARAQQPSQPQTSCASTNNAWPGGIVVVIIDKPQSRSLDLRALSNPCISGVALQIHWADLEPVQGQPEWSKLDQLFAAAKSSHKWVQLLIFPGFFSPAWALQGGVKTQTFAIQYGPGKGTVMALPIPWDRIYLERWLAFLKANAKIQAALLREASTVIADMVREGKVKVLAGYYDLGTGAVDLLT